MPSVAEQPQPLPSVTIYAVHVSYTGWRDDLPTSEAARKAAQSLCTNNMRINLASLVSSGAEYLGYFTKQMISCTMKCFFVARSEAKIAMPRATALSTGSEQYAQI
jgi:hypothetical protein